MWSIPGKTSSKVIGKMNAFEMHQRADNLEPASPSFFVFLSHDDIFIAQQRRQRWSMRVATEAAMARLKKG
jgi:hypothetical protein